MISNHIIEYHKVSFIPQKDELINNSLTLTASHNIPFLHFSAIYRPQFMPKHAGHLVEHKAKTAQHILHASRRFLVS